MILLYPNITWLNPHKVSYLITSTIYHVLWTF